MSSSIQAIIKENQAPGNSVVLWGNFCVVVWIAGQLRGLFSKIFFYQRNVCKMMEKTSECCKHSNITVFIITIWVLQSNKNKKSRRATYINILFLSMSAQPLNYSNVHALWTQKHGSLDNLFCEWARWATLELMRCHLGTRYPFLSDWTMKQMTIMLTGEGEAAFKANTYTWRPFTYTIFHWLTFDGGGKMASNAAMCQQKLM